MIAQHTVIKSRYIELLQDLLATSDQDRAWGLCWLAHHRYDDEATRSRAQQAIQLGMFFAAARLLPHDGNLAGRCYCRTNSLWQLFLVGHKLSRQRTLPKHLRAQPLRRAIKRELWDIVLQDIEATPPESLLAILNWLYAWDQALAGNSAAELIAEHVPQAVSWDSATSRYNLITYLIRKVETAEGLEFNYEEVSRGI